MQVFYEQAGGPLLKSISLPLLDNNVELATLETILLMYNDNSCDIRDIIIPWHKVRVYLLLYTCIYSGAMPSRSYLIS